MPVLENPVSTRLEILRTVYKLADKQVGKKIKLDAAQINGGYYSEIYHQMLFLQERGLVEYNRNIVSKRFFVSITEAGKAFLEDAYHALTLEEPEKDRALKEIFARIKI